MDGPLYNPPPKEASALLPGVRLCTSFPSKNNFTCLQLQFLVVEHEKMFHIGLINDVIQIPWRFAHVYSVGRPTG